MKKTFGLLISLAVLLLCLPYGPHASALDDACIIDMHGTRTYLGTAANWGKTWDASNFEDVTNKDVNYDGSLTVKAGTVRNITNNSSGALNVSGGTVTNINSYGSVTISGGTIRGNIVSNGDGISLGGKCSIRGALSASKSISFTSGKITVGGSAVAGQSVVFGAETVVVGGAVSANQDITFFAGDSSVNNSITGLNIVFNSNVKAKISGAVRGHNTIKISDCTLVARNLDTNSQGTLEISGYKGTLPSLTNMANIVLDANDKVICKQNLEANSLTLKSGSEFVAYSGVAVNTLNGPGTICFNPGALTIHYWVADLPILIFNNPVENGTVAFKSDGYFISTTGVCIYGYDLTETTSGGYTLYKLNFSGNSGLAFDTRSINLDSSGSSTIHVTVAPSLSNYADGTKIVWEFHGDTSAFSMSGSGQTCNVSASSSSTGYHKAVAVAYLVDRNGTPLSGYRADSCTIVQGASNANLRLDTTTVSVLTGDRYGILAMGAATKPAASSSNTSVASLDGGKETKDKSGNTAWLYSVTGGTSGIATIDIGGQDVTVAVNSGILMDTLNYTMAPKAKYCVGIAAKGVSPSDLSVYSTSGCVEVKYLHKDSRGLLLYQINGVRSGTADIVYQITNGQSVKTHVTVKTGAKSYGRSARLVALKQ